MTKISNTNAYTRDITITDSDYIIGSDGDTSNKQTKNYFFGNIRDYLLAGLAPEVGGTLKLTEIAYNGELYSTPSEVVNALVPDYAVLQYNIVIVSLNGDKYLLKLQDITIGAGQTAIEDTDFIVLNANFQLGDGISLYKGFNEATQKEEHYSLKTVGLSITKEMSGSDETGNVLIDQKAQTNLGSGILVYKGINPTTKLQEFYTLSSPDHDIEIVSNEIVISNPESTENSAFHISNTYTGDEELGTVTKPFKDIPQALVAYVGGGDNLNPDFLNKELTIHPGTDYTFTGSLLYAGLNLRTLSGVVLNLNPSDLVIDADSIGDVALDLKITRDEGSTINLLKRGFRNKGTTLNTSSGAASKVIRLMGMGTINIAADASVASPSIRSIIESNETNTAGYFNDGNVATFIMEGIFKAPNSKIYKVGGNSQVYILDAEIQYGDPSVAMNVLTKPFEQIGGYVNRNNVRINILKDSGDLTLDTVFNMNNTALIQATSVSSTEQLSGFCEYLLSNDNATLKPVVQFTNLQSGLDINTSIAKSTVLWDNVVLRQSVLDTGTVNSAQLQLVKPCVNSIGGQIVENLNEYASKNAAVTAGLFNGCIFVNKKTVTAGSFVVGVEYKILTIGSTDFTAIGASANTVGLYFTASGVGTGTGTANNYTRDVVI